MHSINKEAHGDAIDYKFMPLILLISASHMVLDIDLGMMGVILPSINNEFIVSAQKISGLASFYALVFASMMLVGGKCADLFGQRAIVRFGLVVFALGTLLAGFSPKFEILLIARALQGLGAAFLAPANFSIINTAIPAGSNRHLAYGVFGTLQGLSILIGPVFSGMLTSNFGWRAAYIGNFVLIILVLFASFIVPIIKHEVEKQKFDFLGAVLFVPSILAIVLSITSGSGLITGDVTRLILLVFGLLSFGAFLMVESRTKFPLLPLDIFKHHEVLLGQVAQIANMAAMSALFILPNIVMQKVMGWSPTQSGLGMMPHAITLMVAGLSINYLMNKMTLTKNVTFSFSLLILGAFINSFMRPDGGYLYNILIPMIIGAAGGMLTVTMLMAYVSKPNKHEHQGVVSGLNFTSQQIGLSIGSVIILSIAQSGTDTLKSLNMGFLTASAIACFGLFVAVGLWKLKEIIIGTKPIHIEID